MESPQEAAQRKSPASASETESATAVRGQSQRQEWRSVSGKGKRADL
ncbi:MAG: hypothetical protein MW690_001271 [Methanophagales archaeon]|nr:hypothetical protein [Methanophagales archaeon]